MVKRSIGIDVGSSHLCAVQVLRIGKAFCIERVFDTQARRGTDSPSDTLKTLVNKHGFDRRAAVAISLPNDAVFFRSLETDSIGLERIREAGYSVFDYDFPLEADEMVVQPCSYRQVADQRYSILTAAVAKESLRRTRAIVDGARMHPSLIGATVFSVHSTVSLNHPESRTGVAIIAHIAESHVTLTITENNRILIVRHFPLPEDSEGNGDPAEDQIGQVISREAGITWRKLFEAEISQDTRVYLVAGTGNIADLRESIEENLHCRTRVVNPYARVLLKHVGRPSTDISVAEGLALRTLAPEHMAGINFLQVDSGGDKSASSLRKELAICAALAAAIAVVSFAGLFMRLSQLEGRYAEIRDEIEHTFQSVLPQERNIVNPLAQLDQKLGSLREDYALFAPALGGAGPLDVLYSITTNTPEEMNVNLEDILITPESVRLTGTADSYESVYKWQRLLQNAAQFSAVDVKNPQKMSGSELIRFTVLATVAAREQNQCD